MQNKQVIINILKPAVISYISISVIFAIISFKYSELLFGWLYGGLIALISFCIGSYLLNSIKLKENSKTKVFWLAFLRIWAQMFIHAGFLFLLIFINTSYNEIEFLHGGIKSLKGPISFFSYLGGIMLITFSTIIHIFKYKKGKHETVQR